HDRDEEAAHVDGEREAGPASFDRLDAMPCGVGHSTGALAPLEIRRRIPRGDLPDPFGKLRLFQAEATAYGDLPRGQRLNGVDGLDATSHDSTSLTTSQTLS